MLLTLQSGLQSLVGRIRARYLAVRFPNPPVRTVRAAFIAHGSRKRDLYRKFLVRHLHGLHRGQLALWWLPLYSFPTLFLRAFAISSRPGVHGFPVRRLLRPV
jgi:hypothetical protein